MKFKEELSSHYSYLSNYDDIYNLAVDKAISDILKENDVDCNFTIERYLKRNILMNHLELSLVVCKMKE